MSGEDKIKMLDALNGLIGDIRILVLENHSAGSVQLGMTMLDKTEEMISLIKVGED